MPTTPAKNLLYRAVLPVLAPRVRGKAAHVCEGRALDMKAYGRLLARHHVHGASLLLRSSGGEALVYSSLPDGQHVAAPGTLFRVASLTKMATSLIILRMVQEGAFTLDTQVCGLLPVDGNLLPGVTVRHLLSHTSGLRDTPEADRALAEGRTLEALLREGRVVSGPPGPFSYCNLGFGLLGCVMESVTGTSLRQVFDQWLLGPAAIAGTIDASTLDPAHIMPCTRVLPYRPGQDVKRTVLGTRPLDAPDPQRHFGHTAGALYTDAYGADRLLEIIQTGFAGDQRLLGDRLLAEMRRVHAVYGKRSPTLSYGLGLLLVRDPSLSPGGLIGHQGLAYGCVDEAFLEEATGRRAVFLNGGCSEARVGMLTCSNYDMLRFALREMKAWPS